MPDLNDRDRFDEGLPVNPMPASEVRRRGDRMRRRNTVLATVGGVAAAAVFIGLPVAVVANQGGDDVQPAPAPDSQTWLQEVPADFPLAANFPERSADGSPTEVTPPPSGPVVNPGDLCGYTWLSEPPADAAGYSYTGESEDTLSRTLLLLPDDTSAETAVSELRDAVAACPEHQLENATMVNRLEDVDLGTEESLVYSQQVVEEDQSISGLFMTQIGRSGNALLMSTSYGAAGGDQVIEFEADRLRKQAGIVLSAMCVFSADPCDLPSAEPSASTTEPSSPPPSDALADFPLDMGMPETNGTDGSPIKVSGKPGVGLLELCDAIAYDPGGGTTDVIGVEASDVEYHRARTLGIYLSEAAAADVLDNAAAALEACPEEASEAESGGVDVNTRFDVELGDQSLVWTQRYRAPGEDRYVLGLEIYHMVRVGNAVYVAYEASEASPKDHAVPDAVQEATEDNRPIVEAMEDL